MSDQVTTPVPSDPSVAAEHNLPAELNKDWLEAFYRECGREVTLAYTTLNQMKNWAMLAVGAAISGLAFGSEAEYPTLSTFAGVVFVYSLVLRFFFRAVLCYINLGRWNTLQARCVSLKLLGDEDGSPGHVEEKLRSDIQNYYYRWLSVYDRKTQLLANLKLGFALLFAMPLGCAVWGGARLMSDSVARGIMVFALGHTLIEASDFLKSGFFDNVAAYQRRKVKKTALTIFPIPITGVWYAWAWCVVVVVSLLVAWWPSFWEFVSALWTLLRP